MQHIRKIMRLVFCQHDYQLLMAPEYQAGQAVKFTDGNNARLQTYANMRCTKCGKIKRVNY